MSDVLSATSAAERRALKCCRACGGSNTQHFCVRCDFPCHNVYPGEGADTANCTADPREKGVCRVCASDGRTEPHALSTAEVFAVMRTAARASAPMPACRRPAAAAIDDGTVVSAIAGLAGAQPAQPSVAISPLGSASTPTVADISAGAFRFPYCYNGVGLKARRPAPLIAVPAAVIDEKTGAATITDSTRPEAMVHYSAGEAGGVKGFKTAFIDRRTAG